MEFFNFISTLDCENTYARGIPGTPVALLIEFNLPDHFRRCRRPTFQRKVFLLQRQQQAQRGGVPVSVNINIIYYHVTSCTFEQY